MSNYYPVPSREEIRYRMRQEAATRGDVQDAEERIMKRLDELFRASTNMEPPARRPVDPMSVYFGETQP